MPEASATRVAPIKKVSMGDLFGGLADTAQLMGGGATLPLSHIEPDPAQPRRTFPEESLRELAQSIHEQGVLQPVIVRPVARDRYLLIAGERRWRAARLAGLERIPAVIKDVDEATTRVMSLVENLQREDLRDEERAAALQELKRLRHATWEEVGRMVGLSEPRVKALAQLLREPPEIQEMLASSAVTEKHLALTRILKDGRRAALLREVARRNLSTGQTRAAVELLMNDEHLSAASALRQVLDGTQAASSSASPCPPQRIYAWIRLLERFPEESQEADPELVSALALLEKQTRALRRRLQGV